MIKLTEGAIARISTCGPSEADVKPVLQVADIRLVTTSNPSSNAERYRAMLSDGVFTMQGMLATQRNDLVRAGRLQKGSILQLTQFVCNLIQNRRIIIMVDVEVLVEKCDIIGEPKLYAALGDGNASPVTISPTAGQPMNRPAAVNYSPSYGGGTATINSPPQPNAGGGIRAPFSGGNRNTGSSSFSAPLNSTIVPPVFPKTEASSYVSRPAMGNTNYGRPPQQSYQQPPPIYSNRGPVAKNDAAPRIIPIAALNPYQGRWTIKARVTTKTELRRYNNARGEGKVFSFDLLDSDGGEIRVTCFNAVADQFYQQIEPGRVYMISRGTLKPAQKAFNHLRNDHEITLDNTSTIEPCFDDDQAIPRQQFHFHPISDIEGLENNTVLDVIAIVTSITPSSSIMRKNGTGTQKRIAQLKDFSGKSVELTLWGNFCDNEGQTLQNMCDSGVFPVLAVKSGRVNDFNGKSIGTIATSQLFIDPDFPEAQKLKVWFENEGKITHSISISRETTLVRPDTRKTISQIKDEKLGTSEKPDWITIAATISFIKVDNFCYTACPLTIGERQCSKKVTNDGDGKWRCERCDQSVEECDYRYILQMQIQDHTGLTWVTAFQETGQEIMGIPAKELYHMKYEDQNDEKFSEVMRGVLFNKHLFKLKVKEEMFSDEQRVKSSVVKVDKINFQTETRYLLDMIGNLKGENEKAGSSSVQPRNDRVLTPSSGGMNSNAGKQGGVSEIQMGSYGNHGNQYGGGHDSGGISGPDGAPPASGGVNGHWARECPNDAAANQYGGNGNVAPGRYGLSQKQNVGF